MVLGTFYSGLASNFPSKDTWKDFDSLFNLNKSEMCAAGDSDSDVGAIYNAIKQNAALVETRVILAIIMQESSANVGVITTGNHDAGLMQAEGSPGFPGQHSLSQVRLRIRHWDGGLLIPLQDQITAMVKAGTEHFKANLEQLDNQDTASTIYRALRLYNSGSLDDSNLSNGLGATESYVSDVANRLQGHKDTERKELSLNRHHEIIVREVVLVLAIELLEVIQTLAGLY